MTQFTIHFTNGTVEGHDASGPGIGGSEYAAFMKMQDLQGLVGGPLYPPVRVIGRLAMLKPYYKDIELTIPPLPLALDERSSFPDAPQEQVQIYHGILRLSWRRTPWVLGWPSSPGGTHIHCDVTLRYLPQPGSLIRGSLTGSMVDPPGGADSEVTGTFESDTPLVHVDPYTYEVRGLRLIGHWTD